MTLDPRTIERSDLEGKLLPELQRIAQSLGVTGSQRLRKGDLIAAIIERSAATGEARAANTMAAGTAIGIAGRSARVARAARATVKATAEARATATAARVAWA